MRGRTLITTGIVGAMLAVLCCTAPLLTILFGTVGLTAWLAKADYVLIPALIIWLPTIILPYRSGIAPPWRIVLTWPPNR